MDAPQLTCDLVDRDDVDQRYLAGTLPPSEAEAFEEHYFGCARCWALVGQGLALRATAAEPSAPRIRPGTPLRDISVATRHRRWWMGLGAASVILVSMAVWHPWSNGPSNGDAMRGADAPLVASGSVRGDSIVATWPRVRIANDYRVRVSAPDGTSLLERELVDSEIVFPRSALRGATTDTVYVSVLARDALRRPVARSVLTPLVLVRR